MNFTNIPLKTSYDSGEDDLVWDFYVPTLQMAVRYDRIAGFFSSSSMAVSARGMQGFIQNNGHMRLVTCPRLSAEDVEIVERASASIDDILLKNFITDYESIETEFQRDHVKALGWMIANGLLEIKIAVIRKNGRLCSDKEIIESGIMHQKVGILYDSDGNIISFSGSNNESASGWYSNVEEFKVFKSWEFGNVFVDKYIKPDQQKFIGFWEGKRDDVTVIDVPDAIHESLIEISKGFNAENIALDRYYQVQRKRRKAEKEELKLFFYQQNAVKKWNDNGRMLLLEMATGCGKTRTSIGCVKQVLDEKKPVLVVIACPMKNLSEQWKEDIEKLDVSYDAGIVINGDVTNWKILLSRSINKLSVGRYKSLIVFTTHGICSDKKFIDCIKGLNKSIITFLIGDEVHGMGSAENRKGLLDLYQYRIGCSATPSRWFDDYGSQIIQDYFGGDSFKFTIHDALVTHNPYTNKPYLVNFTYHAKFVGMTEDELDEYQKLTNKIKKLSSYGDKEHYNEALQNMLFKRADLEKTAENKYAALENILDEIMAGESIDDTIIFVAPQQMDRVMQILKAKGITFHRYTQEQGTTPLEKYGGVSERKDIENHFKNKDFQVLLAVKCLDEGIDIPSADRAIIMASSTNPREYVQRTGRIIRQAPGKYRANLYDIILKPDLGAFGSDEMAALEKQIFEKEMVRAKDLARDSINSSNVYRQVTQMLREVLK